MTVSEALKNLERNIKVRLAALDLTIAEIADLAGISRVTISQRKAKALSGEDHESLHWISSLLFCPVLLLVENQQAAVFTWQVPGREWWPVAGYLARSGQLSVGYDETSKMWADDEMRRTLIERAASCH